MFFSATLSQYLCMSRHDETKKTICKQNYNGVGLRSLFYLPYPDIDECAGNQGLGPCMEQCHNSPGSYRCSCSYGHILAGDGHSCIAECPPGFRKQPTMPSENSTAPALREECVGREAHQCTYFYKKLRSCNVAITFWRIFSSCFIESVLTFIAVQ